jgi:hypothetical protein
MIADSVYCRLVSAKFTDSSGTNYIRALNRAAGRSLDENVGYSRASICTGATKRTRLDIVFSKCENKIQQITHTYMQDRDTQASGSSSSALQPSG